MSPRLAPWRPRAVGEAALRPILDAPEEAAKRWLMALLGSVPLEAVSAIPMERFIEGAPPICAQAVHALCSDPALDRISGGERPPGAGATGPAAPPLAEIAGAGDGAGAVHAVEALRAALWGAIGALEPALPQAELLAVGDRLAHVCSLLAARAISELERSAGAERPAVVPGVQRRPPGPQEEPRREESVAEEGPVDRPPPGERPESVLEDLSGAWGAPEAYPRIEPRGAPGGAPANAGERDDVWQILDEAPPHEGAPGGGAAEGGSGPQASVAERLAPAEAGAPETTAAGRPSPNGGVDAPEARETAVEAVAAAAPTPATPRDAGADEQERPSRPEAAEWTTPIGPALDRHADTGVPFAVLLIEVVGADRLRRAMPVGELDALMRHVQRALVRELRPSDRLGQEGAGRWWLVASETHVTAARLLGERLARGVRASVAHHGVPLEIAVGVASCPEDGSNADELANHAERELYNARAFGLAIAPLRGSGRGAS
jgi:GGDEF domain-containing protein